jgi:hypothetical protein
VRLVVGVDNTYRGRDAQRRAEVTRMFTELTDDLLDLTATEKSSGLALYAANEEPACCSCSVTIVFCTSCYICW